MRLITAYHDTVSSAMILRIFLKLIIHLIVCFNCHFPPFYCYCIFFGHDYVTIYDRYHVLILFKNVLILGMR